MGQFNYTQPQETGGTGGGTTITNRAYLNDANSLPTKDRLSTSAGNFEILHRAENESFIAAGAGAVRRLSSIKMQEIVSIFDFGAIRNPDLGTTAYKAENDAAILLADAYCSSTGNSLHLGDYGDVLDFSVGFSLAGNYSVISNGHLRLALTAVSAATFITIGGNANGTYYNGYFKFRHISSVAYTDSKDYPAFTGIRFINIVKSYIDLTGEGIELFGTAVEFKGTSMVDGTANGCAYNVINLPIAAYSQRSIRLYANGAHGFVNSNTFYGGGSYIQSGSAVTYGITMEGGGDGINSNVFIGFTFEMGGANNIPVWGSGSCSDNVFRDFRNEANANPSNIFVQSTSVDFRRNFFFPLYNDPGNYLLKCDVVDCANGTFNVYHQESDIHTQHFAAKYKARKFYPVTTGSLTTIKGLQGYNLAAGVISSVTGFSAGDATIAAASFKFNTANNFFGKLITLGSDPYVFIKTLQTETDVLGYVYIVPYLNGSIVPHTDSGGLLPVVTSNFVKNLKNTFSDLASVNANIIQVQDGDIKTANNHLLWFDTTQVDKILVLFGRGVDAGAVAQSVTWKQIEISTGTNTGVNNTAEALQFVFTDNDYVGLGNEESPLLSKITATVSTGGTTTLPASTPAKGVIITGTAADTVSIGTTVAGTDIVDTAVLDANGKFISNDLLYWATAQILYVSGNTNPVTIILPI